MNLKDIVSFKELQGELKGLKRGFLLLYKKGSEQSECAFNNLKDLNIQNSEIGLLCADVSVVRDIHEKYNVASVPALLEFEKDKMVKVIKGCHEPGFFKSLLENSLYLATGQNTKERTKRVTVYSTPTCPHCTTLKNYLKDKRIMFRDIDVSKDQGMAQQMVKKSGQQGVPQIEINGRIIVGFNKPKIDELLEIR